MSLHDHLATGLTNVARAWSITRRDGVSFGFTDHDLPLTFDGLTYEAEAGMTAQALTQTSGLAVDNTDALGALVHDKIAEADILAGRYDGAEVRAYEVNWRDVTQRRLAFKGTIGEVRRGAGAFEAELRGLTAALNEPQGRAYHRNCTAVLGDRACRFDTTIPGFAFEIALIGVEDRRILNVPPIDAIATWFDRGFVAVLDGAAQGLTGVVKRDDILPEARRLELWAPMRADLAPGDRIRVTAGCDKRIDTCAARFSNVANFQGFPHIPGEDWLTAVPKASGANTGGRLR
ncbi:MAG: DUF2163 domain-containing protein [Shimia sp.]